MTSDNIQKLINTSDQLLSINIEKRILKEKFDAETTIGINGGIFKIDQSLILFVKYLIDMGKTINVALIDHNKNPILIKDLEAFQADITDRYFSASLKYHADYSELQARRNKMRIGILPHSIEERLKK